MSSKQRKEIGSMQARLRVLFFVGVVGLMGSTLLQAQVHASGQRPEVDLAVTYSTQQGGLVWGGNRFWMQGGSAELSATVSHGFGVAMNIAGLRASNISSDSVNLTMITTTFGPRYTWAHPWHANPDRQVRLFGQALIGEAHGLDSVFPSASGSHSIASSFALQIGGGVDLTITRHFALRPIQADWVRTQFPNASTNVQNNLRFGTGLVARF